ncbi:SusC/RagA family TonB-linked outer membrane protein [Pedobacter arcticus]|uniref:SusC/RagA family TonB-linked outer membrane protein n=1 Tax=Pedobacter arcticus TaxID=752140 RepID=UPI0003152497|nr:TonB-dependent receptor [Pedobacter arcticus]
MNLKKLTFFFIIYSIWSINAFAQRVVNGTVKDQNGAPLMGVAVSDKNGAATQTNGNGEFKISVADNATLYFSYLGFKVQTMSVKGNSKIEVTLLEDTKLLESVVVIGYGVQKKSDLTGAVSTLNSKAYKDQPVLNVSAALQGRVAGVSVTNNSGAPGGQTKIRIRGANSVNNNNSPLYVVDGVALTSLDLQDINVNDIESMELLKDASATAVYGSRGANGVIIVTTKKGVAGKNKISYNAFVSSNKAMEKYDLMDAVTYAEQANLRTGLSVFPNPAQFAGKSTDWQNLLFDNATTQSHQLSLSGGAEKAKYFVSANYIDQNGLLINTNQEKYGLRSNLDFKINEKLSFGLNVVAQRTNSKNNGDLGYKGNPVMAGITWAPTEKVYDDEATGAYNRNAISPIWLNPYMTLKESEGRNFSNAGIFNGRIKYDFTDWLSLSVNAGLDALISKSASLRNKWMNPTNMGSSQGLSEAYTFQNSNVLTFHKNFNQKHDLTATALAENTSSTFTNFAANGSNLSSTSNGYYNLGLNGSQSISSGYSKNTLLSFMGRVAYSFNNKYLATASLRRDGSSKFQGSNKWGNFPSFSLGWKLSEEQFIKDIKFISELKLRGGWGEIGNQGINAYSTLGLLNPVLYSFGTLSHTQGYTAGSPATPDVKWETTKQIDLGIDLGLFGNRITIVADYYNKNTDNLLLFTKIDNYDGGGSLLKNIGKVNNKGFEFAIDAKAITADNFSWNTGFNIAFNKNKVVSLGKDNMVFRAKTGSGLINTEIQTVKVGEPLGAFYLIPWQGIYSQDDATLGYKAGDNRYTDVSGNNSIGYEDRVISGSATPKVQLGFNNNFTYKAFELNVFFQGSFGNKIFNATYASTAVPTSDVAYPTLQETVNYWTPQNRGAVWANPASKTNRNYVESTQFLQDGSYVRLKNVSLSYSVPQTLIKKLSSIKITASAQNYLTFTKYKGFDPEATSTPAASDADAGIDLGAYPSPKTLTLGLGVNF